MAEPNDTDETGEEGADDESSAAPIGVGGLAALDLPGAAQAMQRLITSSEQARAALRQAREQIKSRQYNKALPWLAISQALSQPTRTGAFGEVMGNLAGALQGPVRERDAFEQQRDKDMLGINTQIAGLDEKTATAQLKLAELRARLGIDAAKVPVQRVRLPNGKLAWRNNQEAQQYEAWAPEPTPQFTTIQQPLPNGMIQPMNVDSRTGERTPAGEPYRPVTKLSGSSALAAQGKLATTAILRQQLEDVKARWFGDKEKKIEGIKNTFSAGKLQGWLPSEHGEAFDKAVAAMRGTIRQLTRVPGEGSMSDWEGKIDQAKLPERGDYESVTEQTFDQLEKLINGYENTTRQMLGMESAPIIGAPPPTSPAPPSQPTAAAASAAPRQAAPQEEKGSDVDVGVNVARGDTAGPVAPPEALAKLKANPTSGSKAWFIHTFGYLPEGYSWDAATRGEYVKRFKALPDGFQ
jgi:hypothetical protein